MAGSGEAVGLGEGGVEVEGLAGAPGEDGPVLLAVVEEDAAGDAVQEVGEEAGERVVFFGVVGCR